MKLHLPLSVEARRTLVAFSKKVEENKNTLWTKNNRQAQDNEPLIKLRSFKEAMVSQYCLIKAANIGEVSANYDRLLQMAVAVSYGKESDDTILNLEGSGDIQRFGEMMGMAEFINHASTR